MAGRDFSTLRLQIYQKSLPTDLSFLEFISRFSQNVLGLINLSIPLFSRSLEIVNIIIF